jgi:hypothetical protein
MNKAAITTNAIGVIHSRRSRAEIPLPDDIQEMRNLRGLHYRVAQWQSASAQMNSGGKLI